MASKKPSKTKKLIQRFFKTQNNETLKLTFDPYNEKIPPVVEETIQYLLQHGLNEEGIFRVPGYPQEIKELKFLYAKGSHFLLLMNLGKHPVDLKKYQIISIASLLKLFLLELPEPLLTFELFDSFLQALEVRNLEVPEMYTKIFCIKNVVNLLPIGNRKVLAMVMNLLKEVTKKSSINLMSSSNLAVVFAASLLRCREPKSFQDMMKDNVACSNVLDIMINRYEEIFVLPSSPINPTGNSKNANTFYQSLQHASIQMAANMLDDIKFGRNYSIYEEPENENESELAEVNQLADAILKGNKQQLDTLIREKQKSLDNTRKKQVRKTIDNISSKFIIKFENGDNYEGETENGVPHGFGIMKYSNGDRYEGDFLEGSRIKGRLIERSGNTYDGEFKGDTKSGSGIYSMTSGNTYTGDFKNGKANGYGVYYYAATGGIYNGGWKDDLFEGLGTYTGNNTKYEGEFVRGKRQGRGTFITISGNTYSGEYLNGKMHGKGVYAYNNGDRYEGDFKDGCFHGQGIYYSADGTIVRGTFVDGAPIDKGKKITKPQSPLNLKNSLEFCPLQESE